jgi:hypothetical protein
MSYTKLFHSILDSSIWQESHQTRIVWVTMLAMADQHGEVQAAVPGLAKRAGVTLKEAEEAIATLCAPDQYSRTPDHEGRRIAKIDGGWEILNHAKYRHAASLEDRKEKAAERAKRFRDKNKPKDAQTGVTVRDDALPVTPDNAPVTLSDDKQKQIQMQKQTNNTPKPPRGQPVEPESFTTFWNAYPKKVAKPMALKSWTRLSPNEDTVAQIIQDVIKRKASEDWTKDQGKYTPNPSTYLNNQRWTDLFEIPETKETLHAKLTAHPANPKGTQCTHATEEEKTDFKAILERYKAMP